MSPNIGQQILELPEQIFVKTLIIKTLLKQWILINDNQNVVGFNSKLEISMQWFLA